MFAEVKTIDMGQVAATVELSGKRQTAGRTILKQKKVSVKSSALPYLLNKLLAEYTDPLDILRVAQDLASRCNAPTKQEAPKKRRIVRQTQNKYIYIYIYISIPKLQLFQILLLQHQHMQHKQSSVMLLQHKLIQHH